MIKFINSTPKDSSEYHKCDMLLSRMERLGMKPPTIGYIPTMPVRDNVLINRDKHFNSLRWNKERSNFDLAMDEYVDSGANNKEEK